MVKKIIHCIAFILVTLFFALFIRHFIFSSGQIPSESMVPTLEVGDSVFIVSTNFDKPERGDVIVFTPNPEEDNGSLWIKRLIGIEGDKVSIKDGKVFVNGKQFDDHYVENRSNYSGDFVVPKDSYFVLGDNRVNSLDSRYWVNPFINEEQVDYVRKFVFFPFNRFGGIE